MAEPRSPTAGCSTSRCRSSSRTRRSRCSARSTPPSSASSGWRRRSARSGIGAVILLSIYWVFGFLRMGTTGLVAQARGAGEIAETGALLMRGLMIAAAAGLVFIAGQAAVFWAAFRLAPASAEVEALARTYLGDPHLGRAGDDRDLRADRLADRDGAGARRAGAAAADERRQRRARPALRARLRLGRCGCRRGDADRRMVGAAARALALPRRFRRRRSGATGRGCSTRCGCGGWRRSTATS